MNGRQEAKTVWAGRVKTAAAWKPVWKILLNSAQMCVKWYNNHKNSIATAELFAAHFKKSYPNHAQILCFLRTPRSARPRDPIRDTPRHPGCNPGKEGETMTIPRNHSAAIGRKPDGAKPVQWLVLVLCIAVYLAMMGANVLLSLSDNALVSADLRYSLPGILAQVQVLAVLVITLCTIRKGYWVGIALCGISIAVTLQAVLLRGVLQALPGVFVPAITVLISSVLYHFKTYQLENGKKLSLSNELLQKVLDTIPMPIFWKDLHSNFLGCNRLFASEAGKNSPEELVGKDDTSTPSGGQTERYRADDAEIMYTGVGKINIEEPHVTANGEPRWIRTTKVPLRDGSGEVFGLLGAYEDITLKKLAEQELYYEKERLRITLLSIGDAVITTDSCGRITLINSVAEQLTGWCAKDALGRDVDDVLSLENELTARKRRHPIDEVIRTGRTVELANHTQIVSRQGVRRIIEDSAAPILGSDGATQGVVMVFRDVTDRKLKQDEILFLNYHDRLTTLYNRRYMEERILKIEEAPRFPLAIILGDINGLKMVNDVLGHTEGDRFLTEASKILTEACRPGDIAARWGGDEFILLLPDADTAKTERICETIREKCAALMATGMNLSLSLGYAVRKDACEEVERTINAAEEVMYTQKLLNSRSYRNSILESFRKTLFEKSHETEEHAQRLMHLCKRMGEAMSLPQTSLQELELLGVLHDIGKIGVPDPILNKPGKLSEEEWVIMRRHCEIGCRITQSIPEFIRVSEYILSHHERWDGNGYPRGLKGEAIPLLSRILCIVDAYDAMTSERAYRKPMPQEAAVEELVANAGKQFDPDLVTLFVEQKLYEAGEETA
jgi:diguanylate cyclase (GGDEF)-like protein/PAS domain S-box-containing protein